MCRIRRWRDWSKLARTVEVFSRRLQIQEQLTAQSSRRIDGRIGAPGRYGHDGGRAYVYDHAGIKKPGSRTVTVVKRGASVSGRTW